MATVAQFNQDQDNQQQQGQNPGGGGQVLNSTGGGSAGGNAGGGATATQARAPQSSTPNINQYLQANQGAGQQLSSGIQGNIQNQANQFNQNVNTAQNSFQNQYQPLQQNLGQNAQQLTQTAFQNPQDLLNAYNASKTQSNNQPLSNDQQNALNQYNQFQQLNTGGYNQDINNLNQAGTQSLNNLQNQYQNLAQQTGAANTESGRFQLLQNTIGQPNYNQGQQTLDALFLQAQPGVANQLKQNLGQIGSQSQQNIQNLAGDTQSKIAALQGLSGQDQQLIKNMFGGGLNDINQNVQNEYNTAQTTGAQTAADITSGLKTNNLTPDQLAQLGIDPNFHTWGLSPQDVMNAGKFQTNVLPTTSTAGGLASVATPEEFARYNALNQLAGGPAGTLQSSIFGGATQAGGYKPVSLDQSALQTAVNTRQQAIAKDDLLAAIQQARTIGGPSDTGFFDQMQQGVQSGALTPDKANQMVTDYYNQNVTRTMPGSGGMGSTPTYSQAERNAWFQQEFAPFENYYQNEYLPASGSLLGGARPLQGTPLDTPALPFVVPGETNTNKNRVVRK